MIKLIHQQLCTKVPLPNGIIPLNRLTSTFIQSETPADIPKCIDTANFVNNSWAHPPFGINPTLIAPLLRFSTGEFYGQNISLDTSIFNTCIRRDIIHNCFIYERSKHYQTTQKTKTAGDVAGSGKKPRRQKKTGKARLGNKRATINKGGGKIFGKVPKDHYFPMNKKVRLIGIKSMLSCKLAEKKLFFIRTEKMRLPKGKLLEEILEPYGKLKILVIHGLKVDPNFKEAAKSIINLRHISAIAISVKPVIKADLVFITKRGLKYMEEILISRHRNYYRNKKIPRKKLPYDDYINIRKKRKDMFQKAKELIPDYDPNKKLKLYSKSLQQYETDLKEWKELKSLEKDEIPSELERLGQKKTKRILMRQKEELNMNKIVRKGIRPEIDKRRSEFLRDDIIQEDLEQSNEKTDNQLENFVNDENSMSDDSEDIRI